MRIDRMERVALRDLWPNEARDFTTWLADNLDLLGEKVGMELSLVEQEAAAGAFSADMPPKPRTDSLSSSRTSSNAPTTITWGNSSPTSATSGRR